jgi:hypothetical protein
MNVGYCQNIISRDALPILIHVSIVRGIRKINRKGHIGFLIGKENINDLR